MIRHTWSRADRYTGRIRELVTREEVARRVALALRVPEAKALEKVQLVETGLVPAIETEANVYQPHE